MVRYKVIYKKKKFYKYHALKNVSLALLFGIFGYLVKDIYRFPGFRDFRNIETRDSYGFSNR